VSETKELKQIKARLDILEAAGEAAGYLVWNEDQGRFLQPGSAPPAPEPDPEGDET
jgi:hypothetical protein